MDIKTKLNRMKPNEFNDYINLRENASRIYTIIEENGLFGVYNNSIETVAVQPVYKSILTSELDMGMTGVAVVQFINNMQGLIDLNTGESITQYEYDEVRIEPLTWEVSYNMIPVRSGEVWGFINCYGEELTDFTSAKFGYMDIKSGIRRSTMKFLDGTKSNYYINTNDDRVFNEGFEQSIDYSDGLLWMPQFVDGHETTRLYNSAGGILYDDLLLSATQFNNGVSIVQTEDNLYGILNEDGTWLIEPCFIEAYDFVNGVALVKYNGLYGYIKDNGEWLMEPRLRQVNPNKIDFRQPELNEYYCEMYILDDNYRTVHSAQSNR